MKSKLAITLAGVLVLQFVPVGVLANSTNNTENIVVEQIQSTEEETPSGETSAEDIKIQFAVDTVQELLTGAKCNNILPENSLWADIKSIYGFGGYYPYSIFEELLEKGSVIRVLTKEGSDTFVAATKQGRYTLGYHRFELPSEDYFSYINFINDMKSRHICVSSLNFYCFSLAIWVFAIVSLVVLVVLGAIA